MFGHVTDLLRVISVYFVKRYPNSRITLCETNNWRDYYYYYYYYLRNIYIKSLRTYLYVYG